MRKQYQNALRELEGKDLSFTIGNVVLEDNEETLKKKISEFEH